MNILELVDRLMHTEPPPCPPAVEPPSKHALRSAQEQINQVHNELAELDAAVDMAVARLRSRGVDVPGE